MRKLKTNTLTTIELTEWDGFVEEVYGRPYAFQQQNGCRNRGVFNFTISSKPSDPTNYAPHDFENDTVPEVVNHRERGVSFKAWLARDPKQPLHNQKYDYELEMWWYRNFYPSIDMIIDDIKRRNLLDPGNYTIIIDW